MVDKEKIKEKVIYEKIREYAKKLDIRMLDFELEDKLKKLVLKTIEETINQIRKGWKEFVFDNEQVKQIRQETAKEIFEEERELIKGFEDDLKEGNISDTDCLIGLLTHLELRRKKWLRK